MPLIETQEITKVYSTGEIKVNALCALSRCNCRVRQCAVVLTGVLMDRLIQGIDDEVVPYKDVLKWTTRLYPAPESHYLKGVDHFFHGRLKTLQTIITDHITAHSPRRRVARIV